MAEQAQLDRLRRDSAVKLKHFMTLAHQTEHYLKDLRPSPEAEDLLRLLSMRQTEYDACYQYLLASRRLADHLNEQVLQIQ
jgi:hypothetical protein